MGTIAIALAVEIVGMKPGGDFYLDTRIDILMVAVAIKCKVLEWPALIVFVSPRHCVSNRKHHGRRIFTTDFSRSKDDNHEKIYALGCRC